MFSDGSWTVDLFVFLQRVKHSDISVCRWRTPPHRSTRSRLVRTNLAWFIRVSNKRNCVSLSLYLQRQVLTPWLRRTPWQRRPPTTASRRCTCECRCQVRRCLSKASARSRIVASRSSSHSPESNLIYRDCLARIATTMTSRYVVRGATWRWRSGTSASWRPSPVSADSSRTTRHRSYRSASTLPRVHSTVSPRSKLMMCTFSMIGYCFWMSSVLILTISDDRSIYRAICITQFCKWRIGR